MKEILTKTIERKILLNPGPATTSIKVKEALIVEDICPREREFGDLLTNVRQKVKQVVNAGSAYEGVLLGGSGTGAIESCLSSCVNTNDAILIIENGAYGKRMKQICDNLGISSEVIHFEWGKEINWPNIENHLNSNPQKFKVMAFVHHETTTGILNSLIEFKKMADKFDLVTLVDAMSSYAGVNIDLELEDVDYLVSSSNKCIQGMAGIGIVIAKKIELERIKAFKKRSFYFDLYTNYLSQKEKIQFLFTPPVQILFSLNAALNEFFDEGGIKERENRYANLYQTMYDGMCGLGFIPFLDEKNNSKLLTTFFEPKDRSYSFEGMHNYLFERGITIYPGKIDESKTFRISNIGELEQEDIQLFLQEVRSYLVDTGISL